MGRKNRYDGLNKYAVEKIRAKAWHVVGMRGFTHADLRDIEQELIMDLLQRLPKYDPTKSKLSTFISRVVDHRMSTILTRRSAQRRQYSQLVLSLDELREMENGSLQSPMEAIDPEDCRKRVGRARRPAEEKEDLSIDVQRFIAKLPPRLRELCLRLQVETVTEISKEMGMSRGAIYFHMGKVRDRLKAAGFKEYA